MPTFRTAPPRRLRAAGEAPDNDGTLVETGAPISVPEEGWQRPEEAEALLARVVVQPITYLSDGLKVRGYLAKPKAAGPHPAVIFNRGGSRDFGAMSAELAVRRLGSIAAWGYVVVAGQYRGSAGGEGMDEFGGTEVDDVLNLIPLLEAMPEVDAKRLGIFGWSRGGMMTYLALTRTNRFSAAVVGAGTADSAESIRSRPEMERVYQELVPNFETERDAQLTARSAVKWPERLNKGTPILLLHGTADWRVEPQQALAMASALLAARHPFRLILLEGGDHGLSEYRAEVDAALRNWLDRYVRDQQKRPSLEPHGP